MTNAGQNGGAGRGWRNDGAAVPAIERGFVRLPEGLMHYRHAGVGDHPAAWLMHASPASSLVLQGLTGALGSQIRAFAPDTPGYGDSAALTQRQPAVSDYADAHRRMLDALEVERTVLYGHHTGAHIAVELAVLMPDRVEALVLEGLLWLEEDERKEFRQYYAPPMVPDAWGTQVFQTLQWLRDQAWFFPHFRRDAAHNLGAGALPAELLHALMIDMLKAGPGYRDAYQAVFAHRLEDRLPMVKQPVVMLCDANDPTHGMIDDICACLSDVRRCDVVDGWSEQGLAQRVSLIVELAPSGR